MRDFLDHVLVQPGDKLVRALTVFMDLPGGRKTLPELAALEPDEFVLRNLQKDNLSHSIRVCGQAPARLRLRWAALYHDVGKARTRRISGHGKVSFHGHEELGARLTRHRLTRLGYDPDFVDDVAVLVDVSGRIASWSGAWTDSAVRRISKELGSLLNDALDLVAADCTSRHESNRRAARARSEGFREADERVKALDAATALRPPVDGERVMALLGVGPCKVVGDALAWLRAEHMGSSSEEAETALQTWYVSRRAVP